VCRRWSTASRVCLSVKENRVKRTDGCCTVRHTQRRRASLLSSHGVAPSTLSTVPCHLRRHEPKRDWRKLVYGTTWSWHIVGEVVTPPGSIHSSVVAQSPTLQFARTSLQQPFGMQIALTGAWLLSRLPKHCRSDNLTAASTQFLLHSNSLI
jgi:hypothetical protein